MRRLEIRLRRAALVLIAAALLVSACESDPITGSSSTIDKVTQVPTGLAITIQEAKNLDSAEPVLVRGYLFVEADGEATLATAHLDSYQPKPGRPTLTVVGFNPADYRLHEVDGRRFSGVEVDLVGVVDGNDLIISPPPVGLGARILGDWEIVTAESARLTPRVERGLITVSFTETELSGIESCAPYWGQYRLEGHRLVLVEIESTAEGCLDWTDDAEFIRLPKENLNVAFAGDRLILSNSTWRFEFERPD